VPTPGGALSLKAVEDDHIRASFHDPRIHFAINCAARSCPPIRPEAYVGSRLDAQLDEQVRKFVAGPAVRVTTEGGNTTVHTTKIMDWFDKDFAHWAGGDLAFLRRYLPGEKAKQLPPSGRVRIDFDDYNWALNDWKR